IRLKPNERHDMEPIDLPGKVIGVVVLAALCLSACRASPPASRGSTPPDAAAPPDAATAGEDSSASDVARALLERHNRERAEAKRPPLALDPKLQEAA